MKLQIVNYNPNVNEDNQTIVNMINIFENIKENISTSKYMAYQNILNKINRFLNMIGPSFEKDIKEIEQRANYFDESNEDDNISIASVSEYECCELEDDKKRESEEIEILKLEKQIKVKYNESLNRFDFEYDEFSSNESETDTSGEEEYYEQDIMEIMEIMETAKND